MIHTAHPWHGISLGDAAPNIVTAFIEIVPSDTVKYEIDKVSGFLKVDRPQKYSNIVPALYGFLPQTYCGEKIAAYCSQKSGQIVQKGDGDPLDICILTEKNISHGNILVQAMPIGGLRLIDKNEADDKIIAVLKDDDVYGNWQDICDCNPQILNRIKHYFLTYKYMPDAQGSRPTQITGIYGQQEAFEVIGLSREDYRATFNNSKL